MPLSLTSLLSKYGSLGLIALGAVAAALLVHSCDSSRNANQVVRMAQDTVKTEEAHIKALNPIVKHDTVTLTKAITSYRTLRDTIVVHDTVLVARADTVVQACESAVASTSSLADVERKENVTLTHEVTALQKGHSPLAPHIGITLGPGVLVGQGSPKYGIVGAVGVTFTPF